MLHITTILLHTISSLKKHLVPDLTVADVRSDKGAHKCEGAVPTIRGSFPLYTHRSTVFRSPRGRLLEISRTFSTSALAHAEKETLPVVPKTKTYPLLGLEFDILKDINSFRDKGGEGEKRFTRQNMHALVAFMRDTVNKELKPNTPYHFKVRLASLQKDNSARQGLDAVIGVTQPEVYRGGSQITWVKDDPSLMKEIPLFLANYAYSKVSNYNSIPDNAATIGLEVSRHEADIGGYSLADKDVARKY